VVQPGQAALISGTAGVITVCTDAPRPDPQRRTLSWAYCLPGRWITLGIMQTAGESLNWFRRAHDPQAGEGEEIFAEYERLAASVPDAGGVVFLPYLNGERTPHWDPAARGVFFGLSLTTGKAHLVRAVMEGVSMGFRQLAEAVEALGTPVGELRAVGGGLRSRTWLETLARVVRRPVVTVTAPDTGNRGNALLCGKAIGLFPSVEEAAARLAGEGARVHHPGPDPAVERQFAVYAELYQRLQPTFRRTFAT
jgi:xylulokinase